MTPTQRTLIEDYMYAVSECGLSQSAGAGVMARLDKAERALLDALEQPAVEPVVYDYKQDLGSKNCMQCVAAYMMGVPLADVPDFERYGPDAWDRFYAFFADRGFSLEMLPPTTEIDGDYFASGDTERGTSHIVVMRGGSLLHDPHPSNAGIKKVNVVWLVTRRVGPLYTAPQAQQPAPHNHVTDGSACWCHPEVVYIDPDAGASVIVHKEPQ